MAMWGFDLKLVHMRVRLGWQPTTRNKHVAPAFAGAKSILHVRTYSSRMPSPRARVSCWCIARELFCHLSFIFLCVISKGDEAESGGCRVLKELPHFHRRDSRVNHRHHPVHRRALEARAAYVKSLHAGVGRCANSVEVGRAGRRVRTTAGKQEPVAHEEVGNIRYAVKNDVERVARGPKDRRRSRGGQRGFVRARL